MRHDYFQNITTSTQAYWLGFIAADGNVQWTTKNKCLSIGLAKKDKSHLLKFINDIEYDKQLSERKQSFRITIYSKKLVEGLITQGIGPRKSLSLLPWRGPLEFMRDYWRGLFDGDGSIIRSNTQRQNGTVYKSWNIQLAGTYEICEAFQSYIYESCEPPYNQGSVRRHKSIWLTCYGGIRPCQNVTQKLYQEYDTSLARKHALATEVSNTALHKPIIQHLEKDYLTKLRNQQGSWEQVANFLGVSRNGLYKHIRKLDIPRRPWKCCA